MDALNQARTLFLEAIDAQAAGDLVRAEVNLKAALALAPGRESILVNLAGVLLASGQAGEAAAHCDEVLRANPDNAQAWLNLALCRLEEDRPETALLAIDRALALAPEDPAAYGNRGSILMLLGRVAEALQAYEQAVALDDADPAWHTARGTVLRVLERLPESVAAHEAALRRDPLHADARWNRALVDLALGNHEAGWQGFEWRWQGKDPVRQNYFGHAPRWQGEAIAPGQTLLVWAEQGLGDTLQFCRYAQLLAGQGIKLILQVQAPLVRLLQGLDPRVRVVGLDAVLPTHDWHCPLLSLAGLCGTRSDSIPGRTPYISVPSGVALAWQARLGAGKRPRVGLMWQGNMQNRGGRGRSLPAGALAQVMALPIDFFFAGKHADPVDIASLRRHGRLVDRSAEITDFADTAAQLMQMDLVLSIDTSVAHLSAAIGRPTWVLLAAGADWRWGLPGDAVAPWYPETTRLFRQAPGEGWERVVGELAEALAQHFACRRPPLSSAG